MRTPTRRMRSLAQVSFTSALNRNYVHPRQEKEYRSANSDRYHY